MLRDRMKRPSSRPPFVNSSSVGDPAPRLVSSSSQWMDTHLSTSRRFSAIQMTSTLSQDHPSGSRQEVQGKSQQIRFNETTIVQHDIRNEREGKGRFPLLITQRRQSRRLHQMRSQQWRYPVWSLASQVRYQRHCGKLRMMKHQPPWF